MKLEFCPGTLKEMTESDLLETIDDGDIDVPQALEILHRNGYEGLVIPDHTPLPECDAPWHAGMAHAVGYLRGILDRMTRE